MKSRSLLWILCFTLLPFLGASAAEKTIVAAHYYAWYGGPVNPHWPGGVAHQPWIGYYSSASPSVVRQQIDVATQYGVDVFAVGWHGQDSTEKKFQSGFLHAPNLNQIKFCIVYDSSIRLIGDISNSKNFDFNDPTIRGKFLSDMTYLAQQYFHHPSYFTVGGRPVLKIYLARRFSGDFPSAIQQARQQWKQMGFNPFLVADSLFYGRNDLYLISQFDAATSYNIFSTGLLGDGIDTTGKLAAASRPQFWNFLYLLRDLKVAGTNQPVDFEPGVIPQFDARKARENAAPLLAQSKDEVVEMFRVAKEISDAKHSGQNIVWITSWNEWHEGTAIEPTVTGGTKYPGGNFGFDFVEAVSEVFR